MGKMYLNHFAGTFALKTTSQSCIKTPLVTLLYRVRVKYYVYPAKQLKNNKKELTLCCVIYRFGKLVFDYKFGAVMSFDNTVPKHRYTMHILSVK